MFPNNSLEYQKSLKEHHERTDEEIAGSNQTYNNYFNELLVNKDLDQDDSEDFSRSVETAENEVLNILSSAGVDEVNNEDVENRVLNAKYEDITSNEIGGSEFLTQRRQDEVEDALVAEQTMRDVESSNADTIAYVNQLMTESESVRGLVQKSRDVGGVDNMTNADLAEFGKDIRNRNLMTKETTEEASSIDEVVEFNDDQAVLETGDEAIDNQSFNSEETTNLDNEMDWQDVAIDKELLRSNPENVQKYIIEEMIDSNHGDNSKEDYDLVA